MNHFITKEGSIIITLDGKAQIEFADLEVMDAWLEMLTDERNEIALEIEQHDAKLEHDPRD